MFVVLYSDEQKCFHIESEQDNLRFPENGFKKLATFETYKECSKYIKEVSIKSRYK